MLNKIFGTVLVASIFLSLPSRAIAAELEISQNGDNSTSEVVVTNTQVTNSQQSNTLDVRNTVSTSANSGNNTSNANTEDVTITTGDVVNAVSVSTSGNTSQSQDLNSPPREQVIIAANGEGSKNNINSNTSNTTNNQGIQVANITTHINGIANTGNNTASGNYGGVSISTGNIKASESIKNEPINTTIVTQVNKSTAAPVSVLVKQNAASSVNNINLAMSSNNIVQQQNSALINNVSIWFLNTGGNIANKNIGGVKITTGNILAEILITNKVNINKTLVQCVPSVPTEKPKTPPTGGISEVPHPSATPTSSVSSSSSSSSSSSGGIGGPQILGLSYTSGEAQYPYALYVLMALLSAVLGAGGGFLYEKKIMFSD